MATSIAELLTDTVRRTGGEISPIASAMGTSWATVRSWATGLTLPRTRDLQVISQVTGLDLPSLQSLRAADHARRLNGVLRIDTVEEAAAVVTDLQKYDVGCDHANSPIKQGVA